MHEHSSISHEILLSNNNYGKGQSLKIYLLPKFYFSIKILVLAHNASFQFKNKDTKVMFSHAAFVDYLYGKSQRLYGGLVTMSVKTPDGTGAAMAPAYPSYSAATVSRTAKRMAVMK